MSLPPPVAASPAAPPTPRNLGLDRARAVAVIAMVMGHTLDAVLSDAARDGTGMLAYWSMRAVTAPLFLFVAGWAFAATVQRTGARGLALPRRYGPRVAVLLAWGYALRWPGWAWPALRAGEPSVWRSFLAFDALHGVAGALLLGTLVLAWVGGRVARMGALGGLALLFALVTPAVREAVSSGGWPLALEQALAGRTSNFPLFPWAAYFFVGGVAGLGLASVRRVPQWLCLAGPGTGVLVLMSLWGGDPRVSDVTLVVWRLGLLTVVAGAAMLLPAAWDGALGPVGRASLWVYVVHLPLAYGWSSYAGLAGRLGRSQDVPSALLLALAVLAVSLALALPAKKLYGRLRADRPGERGGPPGLPSRSSLPL